jgi:2-oxoglutarate dehydrogenase E2 component (dihydrolipoamide succinyltransferase)
MAQFELIMPKMGESIMEATILSWLKKEGDRIEEDEALLEIATDKVDSEVPSPVAGTVEKMLFKEGDVVPVGKVIALIGVEGEASAAPEAPVRTETPAPAPAPTTNGTERPAPEPVAEMVASSPADGGNRKPTGDRFYSPLVLNIARQEKIPMDVLEGLPGSGQGGRVTKKDILAYVEDRKSAPATAPQPKATPAQSAPAAPVAPKYQHGDNVEIIEMDRMRRLISDHMIMSKHTSAHVTSFVEADVTNMVLWRNKVKDAYQQREGDKLTFTPLFVEAIVKCIREFPLINSSVDGYNIVRKKDINIGMAAALPSGNLIVPVIRNADMLNLTGITKKVNDLANRARVGKLKPEEIEGGTFTLTNVGTFGNLAGTPVINQPQVAILATGAIKKKPAVLETPTGDVIAIRHLMMISMSYDHRIIDGSLGGAFIRRFADILEEFDLEREV